ncbi:MAG: hypothetical protein GX427_01380, partial [Actinomycetales bacterium]|nr:hypothetical protein [Actinomycetales bacterium]
MTPRAEAVLAEAADGHLLTIHEGATPAVTEVVAPADLARRVAAVEQ